MAKKIRRWTKLDPSRTKTERQRFMREVRKRFKALERAIHKFLVAEDAFGLEEPSSRWNIATAQMLQNRKMQNRRQYAFLTNPQKVKQFQQWLQQEIDAGVLEVVGGERGKPWTAEFIESAWRKGLMRSYTDVHKAELAPSTDWYRGSKEMFLRSAFLQPEMMSKVEMLATRAFEGMKGVTEQVKTQMSRILADGLVNGYGPQKIARQMTDSIGTLTRSRALVIARTEIIHAHAEGQLDGFKALGISEVSAEVEWSTAGDERVCGQCDSMSGQVFKVKDAHGKIPLHPNCRCCWVPVAASKGKTRRRRK